jgi:hypothetical protein
MMTPNERGLEALLGYRITRVQRLRPGAVGKAFEGGYTICLKLEAVGKTPLMALIIDECMTLWTPPAVFGSESVEFHAELSIIERLAELG